MHDGSGSACGLKRLVDEKQPLSARLEHGAGPSVRIRAGRALENACEVGVAKRRQTVDLAVVDGRPEETARIEDLEPVVEEVDAHLRATAFGRIVAVLKRVHDRLVAGAKRICEAVRRPQALCKEVHGRLDHVGHGAVDGTGFTRSSDREDDVEPWKELLRIDARREKSAERRDKASRALGEHARLDENLLARHAAEDGGRHGAVALDHRLEDGGVEVRDGRLGDVLGVPDGLHAAFAHAVDLVVRQSLVAVARADEASGHGAAVRDVGGPQVGFERRNDGGHDFGALERLSGLQGGVMVSQAERSAL